MAEERIRARLGINLDTESQDFLSQFDHRQNELRDQLARVREDLIKLQETLASDDDIVHASTQFGNSSSLLIRQWMNWSHLRHQTLTYFSLRCHLLFQHYRIYHPISTRCPLRQVLNMLTHSFFLMKTLVPCFRLRPKRLSRSP